MNPYQWWIALVVIVALLCFFGWYVWNLYNSPKQTTELVTTINHQLQVLSTIQQFKQQPILESARVNFLRQLPYDELHDLVMIALSAVNYTVYMDVTPQLYELPALEVIEPDPAIIVDTTLENEPNSQGNKGRLVNSMKSVMDRLEPIVESGQVFTIYGQPVLVSIQVEGASYSRYGLSRLTQACTAEDKPGLLVYLGTAPLGNIPVSSVVILSGNELLAIIDGLES